MKTKVFIIFLTLLASISLFAGNLSDKAKNMKKSARIVGGHAVSPAFKYPFMTALWSDDYDGQFCGGALIHKAWVLTAAHCVIDAVASNIEVIINTNDITSDEGERIGVQQIILHSDYDDVEIENDIALLRLKTSSTYMPIELLTPANEADYASVGMDATVMGWGLLEEEGDSPDILNEVVVPIVSNAECQNSYDEIDATIWDSNICAGVVEGGIDSCNGDSGGPLIVKRDANNERQMSVGIVSWGEGCAQPNYYGIYTRVSSFYGWILQQTSNAILQNDYQYEDAPDTDTGSDTDTAVVTDLDETVNDSDNIILDTDKIVNDSDVIIADSDKDSDTVVIVDEDAIISDSDTLIADADNGVSPQDSDKITADLDKVIADEDSVLTDNDSVDTQESDITENNDEATKPSDSGCGCSVI